MASVSTHSEKKPDTLTSKGSVSSFSKPSNDIDIHVGEVIDVSGSNSHGYDSSNLRKNFSVWSLLGIGFGLTNSWFGISASLITSISSGGPLMIVYGILIIAFTSTFIGITLSVLLGPGPGAKGVEPISGIHVRRTRVGRLGFHINLSVSLHCSVHAWNVLA